MEMTVPTTMLKQLIEDCKQNLECVTPPFENSQMVSVRFKKDVTACTSNSFVEIFHQLNVESRPNETS